MSKRNKKAWSVYDMPFLLNDFEKGIEETRFNTEQFINAYPLIAQERRNVDVSDDELKNMLKVSSYHNKMANIHLSMLKRDDLEIHHIGKDVCRILEETHSNLPEWTPGRAVPGETGFVIFEKPFSNTLYAGNSITEEVPLQGFFWFVDRGSNAIGFVAFTSNKYASDEVAQDSDGEYLFKTGISISNLDEVHNNEEKETNVVSQTGFKDGDKAYNKVMQAIGATLLLMKQEGFMDINNVEVPVKKKQTDKSPVLSSASRNSNSVKVVQRNLRKSSNSKQYAEDREKEEKNSRNYTKRWWVRGHWRQQACGKKWSERKPVFIEPHIAGPEDMELDNRKPINHWKA